MSWFDAAIQVGDRIPGPASGGPTDSDVGGRFMLSRENAEQLLERLDAVVEDLNSLKLDAGALRRMKPPADEPVSQGFNRALVGPSGAYGAFDYAIGHIDRERSYLRELRRRLADALGTTIDTDETNARRFPDNSDRGAAG